MRNQNIVKKFCLESDDRRDGETGWSETRRLTMLATYCTSCVRGGQSAVYVVRSGTETRLIHGTGQATQFELTHTDREQMDDSWVSDDPMTR
jgi:hypothetical protein